MVIECGYPKKLDVAELLKLKEGKRKKAGGYIS
jgi:hypothetical protein